MGEHSKGGFSLAPHPTPKIPLGPKGFTALVAVQDREREQREEEEEMGRLDRLAKQGDAKDSS